MDEELQWPPENNFLRFFSCFSAKKHNWVNHRHPPLLRMISTDGDRGGLFPPS